MAGCVHEWLKFGASTETWRCAKCGTVEFRSRPIPLDYQTANGVLMRRTTKGVSLGDPYKVDVMRDMNGYRAEYGCGCVWEINERSLMYAWPNPSKPQEMCEAFCPSHGSSSPSPPVAFYPRYTRFLEPRPAPPPELELTFETEPVVGWRAWKVVTHRMHGGMSEPRLQSLTGRETWKPMTRCEAACTPQNLFGYGRTGDTHEAPWPSCQCGIWAVRDRESLPRDGMRGGIVCVGEIAMWGRVLEFKRGWRARYAYPKTLTLLADDDELRGELERVYGVEVTCEPPTATQWKDELATWPSTIPPVYFTAAAATAEIEKAMGKIASDIAAASKKLERLEKKRTKKTPTIPQVEQAKKPTPPRPRPSFKDALGR